METNQEKTENLENRATQNLYGLGAFGLETALKIFAGFYIFYNIDELGLAVAIVAIINIVDAISDAANDPLVVYSYERTKK